MKTSDTNPTAVRIGRIASDVALYLRDECREHDPGDVNDALAAVAGELAAFRAQSHEAFESELRRLVGVMLVHARLRRQAQGGPVAAGHA